MSKLMIARSSARGGAGNSPFAKIPPSPAADLKNCQTILCGDTYSWFEAGKLNQTAKGMDAVTTTAGTLLIDPTVRFIPKGNGQKISGSAKLISSRLPSLKATGAAPGRTVTTDLYAEKGTAQLLLASAPGFPLSSPFGELWLDPLGLIVVDSSVMSSSEHRALNIHVPNNPGLRGLAVGFQAVRGNTTGIALSNPAIVILR